MRRSNIFYNAGESDNKFFTFSNYTEALTGNFLSTDTKLFPSRFLCIKLEGLNASNKESFIDILIRYYENKLAVLRDKNEKHHTILSLNYLLETLYRLELDNNKWVFNKGFININDNKTVKINYINDITEQDYDGTYTDTICVVNLDNIVGGSLALKDITNDDNDILSIAGTNIREKLWGWTEYDMNNIVSKILNKNVEDIKPIDDNGIGDLVCDDNNKDNNLTNNLTNNLEYRYSSNISGIKYKVESEPENINSLDFNIIIPLFDMVDINYKNNFTTIDYEYLDQYKNIPGIKLEDDIDNNLRIKNIPLGIWISDNGVKLERDGSYAPTWSLTISSQFKPFPYSNNISRTSSSDSKSNAYSTFAEVLLKLNKAIDKFDDLNISIKNLDERLSNVESNLKQIGTIHNIDAIQAEIHEFKSDSNNAFKSFKNEIYDIVNSLKWKVTI